MKVCLFIEFPWIQVSIHHSETWGATSGQRRKMKLGHEKKTEKEEDGKTKTKHWKQTKNGKTKTKHWKETKYNHKWNRNKQKPAAKNCESKTKQLTEHKKKESNNSSNTADRDFMKARQQQKSYAGKTFPNPKVQTLWRGVETVTHSTPLGWQSPVWREMHMYMSGYKSKSGRISNPTSRNKSFSWEKSKLWSLLVRFKIFPVQIFDFCRDCNFDFPEEKSQFCCVSWHFIYICTTMPK